MDASRTEIPLIDGEIRAAWQRKDLIVAVLHGADCGQCTLLRQALIARRDLPSDPELAAVIVDRSTDEADRLASAALASADAAFVLVADRFLQLYVSLDAHLQPLSVLTRQIGDWADAVITQCGECSRINDPI